MDLPKSVSEARRQGARMYFTGRPCKRGHVAPRYAVNGCCSECLAQDRPHWPDDSPRPNPDHWRRRRAELMRSKRRVDNRGNAP